VCHFECDELIAPAMRKTTWLAPPSSLIFRSRFG
jgi:hypothetical protein